ncbi:putative serpin-like protein [Leptotrombidium deliense]|uniref:Putative serpin-like protein n=1 Tax=Leptotrombidium deliense TaxID=299467 RepID=A0A443SCQ5_9ACAR|nr:putative serpin-like protein [Leptotrombidium deliense]
MDNAFNSFAFNIFRILSENNNDNTLISPYSILTSLNSCLLGAHNETSKEIFEALKYDLSFASTEEVHDFMQKINEQWIAKDNPFTLYSVNCLLLNKENDCEMDSDFERKVNEIYGGIVREADFTNEHESLIESCNEWVVEKTKNMISSIVDQLSPSAKLVLLNAIYFKGNWKTEFHKQNIVKQMLEY